MFGEESCFNEYFNPNIVSKFLFSFSQCDLYNCDLSPLSGLMLKVGVECKNNVNTTDACFVFKMDGVFATNGTFYLKDDFQLI